MRIIVIGGSVAGLSASLLLARDGHEVEVFDRDSLEPAADVESAATTAFRRSAPQLVQLHQLTPLARTLLRDHLPDVYTNLLLAGAAESPVTDRMPPTLADRQLQPDDDGLTNLQARRSTIDWVMRGIAAAAPGVRLFGRTEVTGLLHRPGNPPRVVGVRTGQGDRSADIVIDASGRRSPIDRWLADEHIGTTGSYRTECGINYYSRHYRLRPDRTWPGQGRLSMLQLTPHFGLVACTADNGVFSVAICPAAEDRPFRSLRHDASYEAVIDAQPILREWRAVSSPATRVQPMAGLQGLFRRLVLDSGPVALGLHVIGDAACHMNPTLGRGVGMALDGAVRVTEAIRCHPDSAHDQALTVDAAITSGVQPWFVEQTGLDTAYLGSLRRTMRGEPPRPSPDPADGILPTHVRTAALYDPEVFRAHMRVVGMVRRPAEVYEDPAILARTRGVLAAVDSAAPEQISRHTLLDALESV